MYNGWFFRSKKAVSQMRKLRTSQEKISNIFLKQEMLRIFFLKYQNNMKICEEIRKFFSSFIETRKYRIKNNCSRLCKFLI